MRQVTFIRIAALVCATCMFSFGTAPGGATSDAVKDQSHVQKAIKVSQVKEGPCVTAQLTAGPFDIHRRYRSMEGPWVDTSVRMGDLIAADHAVLPETSVHFVEDEAGGQSPSMKARDAASMATAQGLVDTSKQPRALYWLKGIKLEVLDEQGKVMPTAEFVCHTNIDISPAERNALFPAGERCVSDRLFTITQGRTELYLPEGYAVPVTNDENFRLTLQAANRTTDKHRRLMQRITFYLIKDKDLVYPVTALTFRVPFVSVVTDLKSEDAEARSHNAHPTCDIHTVGVNAPNNVKGGTYTDVDGRVRSGHWVIPPGHHSYTEVITDQDQGFATVDRKLRFAWFHIHPCCTNVALEQCDGTDKTKLCESNIKTKLHPGLEITHIDNVEAGAQPILIHKGDHYQLTGTYDNTTENALDSMVCVGMFFDDPTFKRPDWTVADTNTAYCGIKEGVCTKPDATATSTNTAASAAVAAAVTSSVPLFNPETDGPLLPTVKTVELQTTAGKIRLCLDPQLAPQTATQIYKLLTHKVYDGTRITRYEPGFLLQVSNATDKASGSAPLNPLAQGMVRRLPLEVDQQRTGVIKHKRFMLDMAHYDNAPDSAETSFCIMLGDAPHLDKQYTLFGYVEDDKESAQTIQRIEDQWNQQKPVIESCVDTVQKLTAVKQ